MNVFMIAQHFHPDDTSTSRYLTGIAEALADENTVTVISGTPEDSATASAKSFPSNLRVIRIWSLAAGGGQIWRRLVSMVLFAAMTSIEVVFKAKRGDRVFISTTPALAPYFVTFAARLRRAVPIVILYDLYPDVMIAANLSSERSFSSRIFRALNAWMYPRLDRVVVIGNDMRQRLVEKLGVAPERIAVIPNWVDIAPPDTISSENPVRARLNRRTPLVVGLSGNLGWAHDPQTPFEAARRLQSRQTELHFLFSGWGVGWGRLNELQRQQALPNVTLIDKVPYEELVALLDAADVWIVPYRRGMSGVSVPSRFYNLLAMGKPVITLAEPDADHSQTITTHDIGWVVQPENPDALVAVIEDAMRDAAELKAKGQRARRLIESRYSYATTARDYRAVARGEAV